MDTEMAASALAASTHEAAHVHDHREYQQRAASADRLVLFSMILAMAGVSLLVHFWRSRNAKMFQLVSSLALWSFPALMGLYYAWGRFLVVWALYTAGTVYLLRLARQRPLQRTTPRVVYGYFSALYHCCTYAVVGGYMVFIFVVMAAQPPPGAGMPGSGIPRTWGMVFTDYLFSGMLYGMYFAVLTRDIAELAAETISSALGYYKKNDDDSLNEDTVPPANICALCGEECQSLAAATQAGASMAARSTATTNSKRQRPKPTKNIFDGDDGTAPNEADAADQALAEALEDANKGFVELEDLEAAGAMSIEEEEDEALADNFAMSAARTLGFPNMPHVAGRMLSKLSRDFKPGIRMAYGKDGPIFKLPCKHTFHSLCIKGWTLVGKKNSCPCCNEKVELRLIAGQTIWGKPSVLWAQLLGVVRYFVVWMPLIIATVRFVLYEAGVDLVGLRNEEVQHMTEVMKGVPIMPPVPPSANLQT